MSRSKCKRVFILGAGCSAGYGYPLGAKLVEELRSFLAKIAKIPGGCPVIQGAVSKSVGLAARFPKAATLDTLVNLFEERRKAFKAKEGGHGVTDAHTEQENLTYEQILNAKIATAALFLDKESEARKKTLEGYKECLLPSIFGRGPRWQSAVNDSDCSVLTFNYDRLFEIAFLDYFRDSQGPFAIAQFPLYGKSVLNSGLDPTLDWGLKRIEIKPDRFCFLKLHGSAGWWAKMCATNLKEKRRDYCLDSPQCPTTLLQLEHWLAQNKQFYPWEPLIAFPHEKHRFVNENPGDFPQGPYVTKIWEHAASILKDAKQVRVIGYSFNPIDSRDMVDKLLSQATACDKIVIQNTDVDGVQAALESYRGKLKPLEFDPTPF